MKKSGFNSYEILAVVFSLLSVLLTIIENIWLWGFGLLGVIFYLVVFYRAKLYANMWLQVIFIVLQLYGWYEWLYGGSGNSELQITRATVQLDLGLLLIAIIGIAGMGYGFKKYSDNAMPFADSAATVLSLIAQWMLAKKYIENWLVWIAVNLIIIFLGLKQKLYLTAGLYLVFFILAVIGFIKWQNG
jgi:nicotinamide mononucleotide transporter